MNYLLVSIILVSIILAIVVFIIRSVFEFKRDWPIIKSAWLQMEAFEKRLLYMGLLMFFFIPALKDHPASEWYVARIAIEILPALAGSFFVAGILAFMRQVHEIRQKENA